DLVGGLSDAGADPRVDPLGTGSERHHRRDCRLHDAGKGAAPAAMRGADHANLWISEQHWRAIGGEDAERDARHLGYCPIGTRVALAPPRPLDSDDSGAMDLVTADQPLGREIERCR